MQKTTDKLSLTQRLTAPTPGFFKKLRNIGVVLAAISGTLVAAPVALPAAITTLAGYLAVAGSVLGAVSQTAVATPEPEDGD